jgi:molecular chaperone DnaK
MYQQSGAAGQPGGDTYQGGQQQTQQEAGPKADDIQDADFEEVK